MLAAMEAPGRSIWLLMTSVVRFRGKLRQVGGESLSLLPQL
jgi:hypothetical protein